MAGNSSKIYVETPLIFSKCLSNVIDHPVYLKLENTQPSGSFKLRGISKLCYEKVKSGCKKLIGSSGGNAGIAMAYSASQLGVSCRIFVPSYISEHMQRKLEAFGTELTVGGKDWKMANSAALNFVNEHSEFGFIHPYDHPTIWEGNSTMIEEIKFQLNGIKPSCMITNIGGGGLLMGILKGLEKTGWNDVPILAMETVGADCFNKSIAAGKIVEIEITSIAKSLGARSVLPQLMESLNKFSIFSEVVTDTIAVDATLKFANDHQFLVEPACGATLAAIYQNIVSSVLHKNLEAFPEGPVVVIVCGGSDCTLKKLNDLSQQFKT